MYPTSNVRVIPRMFTLTLDSFHGCAECANGCHGELDDAGLCVCCRWQPTYMAGDRIEVTP